MKLSKIKKYLITSENKVIDVIKKLNINKYKTVIVIDKLNRLIGTITDGDIRRSLLKGHEKNSDIKKVLNKNPKKIFYGKKFTKWKPKFNLDTGLKKTIEWFKKNQFNYSNKYQI